MNCVYISYLITSIRANLISIITTCSFLQNFLNESLKCIDKLFPVAAGQNGSGGGAGGAGAEGLPLTGSDSAKMAAAAAAAAAALAAKNHNQRTAAAAAMMQGGVGGSDKNKAS